MEPNVALHKRIEVVDALRGLALVLIVLIHCVEHFEFFKRPEKFFLFTEAMDKAVMGWVFYLISGKAYSIFALLFGLSFYIQLKRGEQRGEHFRLRFMWRLTILFAMGIINSFLYRGDILHMYALFGLPLVLLWRVPTKWLVVLATLLFLQLPIVWHTWQAFTQEGFTYAKNFGYGGTLNAPAREAYASSNILDVFRYNTWNGRIVVWGWTYDNGRYMQLIAYFIVGLVLGRVAFFEKLAAWRKGIALTLLGAIAMYITFQLLLKYLPNSEWGRWPRYFVVTLMKSWFSLASTVGTVCAVLLLYQFAGHWGIFRWLANFGRMSLSNYIIQSVIGTAFFYGFGLAMYRYMGSTWSLIYGVVFVVAQIMFSCWWMRHFRYGPFEWFWRVLTQMDLRIPMKRTARPVEEEVPVMSER